MYIHITYIYIYIYVEGFRRNSPLEQVGGGQRDFGRRDCTEKRVRYVSTMCQITLSSACARQAFAWKLSAPARKPAAIPRRDGCEGNPERAEIRQPRLGWPQEEPNHNNNNV